MAIQRTRRKVVTLETESTYGTDPTPVAADAIQSKALERTPYDGPTVQRLIDRSTLGGYSSINTSPRVPVAIEAYLASSGGAADALPNWDKLALCCGIAATVTASTEVEYGLVSADADFDSSTVYYYMDGDLQIVTGYRGNLQVNFNQGELPFHSSRPGGFVQCAVDRDDHHTGAGQRWHGYPGHLRQHDHRDHPRPSGQTQIPERQSEQSDIGSKRSQPERSVHHQPSCYRLDDHPSGRPRDQRLVRGTT